MKKTKLNLKPTFSWERPIEDAILESVRHMALVMERRSKHSLEKGWFANNRLQEDCATAAMAYRTVIGIIEREKRIREKIY